MPTGADRHPPLEEGVVAAVAVAEIIHHDVEEEEVGDVDVGVGVDVAINSKITIAAAEEEEGVANSAITAIMATIMGGVGTITLTADQEEAVVAVLDVALPPATPTTGRTIQLQRMAW